MATSGILHPVEVINNDTDGAKFADALEEAVKLAESRNTTCSTKTNLEFKCVARDELKKFVIK
jgi:hypothetical protein